MNHVMSLVKTYSNHDEEWVCPTCGRRIIISWQPWKRTILEAGDENTPHSGGKGLSIEATVVDPAAEAELRRFFGLE